MNIYEVLVFVFLILSPFLKGNKKLNDVLYAFAVVMLVLIAALRGLDVGTDTYHYYSSFCFSNSFDNKKGEYIYGFTRGFFRNYLNYDAYMLYIYTFIVGGIGYVTYRLSDNKFFSLFLFVALGFYTQSFNVMRQYLAITVAFYAIYRLSLRHKIKDYLYFVVFLIASFFIHHSSLLAILYIPLMFLNIKSQWWYLSMAVSFVIGVVFSSYLSVVFEPFYLFFDDYYYLGYFDRASFSASRNILSNMGLNLVGAASLYLTPKKSDKKWTVNILAFSVILNNIFGWGDMIRMTFYFGLLQIIAIPMLICHTKKEMMKYAYIGLVLVFAMLKFYMFTLKTGEILPYYLR